MPYQCDPPSSLSVHRHLFQRETGTKWNTSGNTNIFIGNTIKSSKHFVERLGLWKTLKGHRGCVNSVLFSENGEYVFTGSDDTTINIYHTQTGKLVQSLRTKHTQNIFYAKELTPLSLDPLSTNTTGEMNWIVSCAADGRVILTHLHTKYAYVLYRHMGRAHRISLLPQESLQFYSCGEDGVCNLFDLRDKASYLDTSNTALSPEIRATWNQELLEGNNFPAISFQFVNHREKKMSAYCIGANPRHPYEVAVGGYSNRLLLFDIRQSKKAYGYLCPNHLLISYGKHITGLKYDHTGEILVANYNDESIYSFQLSKHIHFFHTDTTQDVGIAVDTTAARTRLDEQPIQITTTDTGKNTCELDEEEEPEEKEEGFIGPKVCFSRYASMTRYRRLQHDDFVKKQSQPQAYSQPSKTDEDEENTDSIEVQEEDKLLEEEILRGYYQRYSGHRNVDTVKQVGYYGAEEEYVVSGSDCGHIFLWATHTGKLVNVLKGDKIGAINCFAQHPYLPILATSGLESNAKLFMPIDSHRPIDQPMSHAIDYQRVQEILQTNRDEEADEEEEENEVEEDEEEDDEDMEEEEEGEGSHHTRRTMNTMMLQRMLRLLYRTMMHEGELPIAEEDEDEDEDVGAAGRSTSAGTRGTGTGDRTRRSETQEEDEAAAAGGEAEDGDRQMRRRRRMITSEELFALLPMLNIEWMSAERGGSSSSRSGGGGVMRHAVEQEDDEDNDEEEDDDDDEDAEMDVGQEEEEEDEEELEEEEESDWEDVDSSAEEEEEEEIQSLKVSELQAEDDDEDRRRTSFASSSSIKQNQLLLQGITNPLQVIEYDEDITCDEREISPVP